jgi:hypothetical protein
LRDLLELFFNAALETIRRIYTLSSLGEGEKTVQPGTTWFSGVRVMPTARQMENEEIGMYFAANELVSYNPL